MRDMVKLMDGVYEAYNNALPGGSFAPVIADGSITTFCNEAVNVVCRRYGCNDFDLSTEQEPFKARMANDIVDLMNLTPTTWRHVPNSQAAQNLANAGALTIATYKNPNGHGHLAVVVPGTIEYSGKWAEPAPKIMNVGKDVFIGRRASWAFTDVEKPSYFVWEG